MTAPDHSLCPCTNTRPSSGEPLFTSARRTCAAARARQFPRREYPRTSNSERSSTSRSDTFAVAYCTVGGPRFQQASEKTPPECLPRPSRPRIPQPAFRDASVSVSLVSHAEYCSTSQSQAQSIVAYNQLLLRHSDPLLSPRFKFHCAYRRSEKWLE